MGGMGAGWRIVMIGLGLSALAGCSRAMQPPADPDAGRAQTGMAAEDVALETGAVTSIRMTARDRTRFNDMQQFLEGRVAGLQVIRGGNGQYSLRIRGTTSLNMSNEPLVVIDGMPVPPEGVSNALAVLTPDMVTEVNVLKDAGTTAFYGVRGANGVIAITTRRGPDR